MEGGQSVDRKMRDSIGIGIELVVTTHIEVVAMVDMMGSDRCFCLACGLVIEVSCTGTLSHFVHAGLSGSFSEQLA